MSDFPILDDADTQQILDADAPLKQSLVYDLRGKKQISYAGVKWLVLNMSRHEQPLTIDIHEIILDKDGEDKSEWTWYATVKCRNAKTGLETLGASEQPYLQGGRKDAYGRTKALSKAERNAYRKQIPELEIQAMLNTVDPTQVRRLTPDPSAPAEPRITSGPSAPTIEQVQELKELGIKTPPTRFEAAKMIALAKKELNQEQ